MATAVQTEHPGIPRARHDQWVDRVQFPFPSRYLELMPGVRVHYVDEGVGDVVLFVHGTPTWSFEWRHAIAGLSKVRRCIAVDLLGFGLSDRPRDFDYSPQSHAKILRAFVERLDLENITLVVHDYGGPIALPIALDTPERVARLVLINTWMWSLADDPGMRLKAAIAAGALGRLLYRYANLSLRAIMPSAFADKRKLTPEIHRQYLAPFPDGDSRQRVLFALARALMGSSAYYQSLWEKRERLRGKPAMIVWGTKDPAFTVAQLARWRSLLPEARVLELPVGHWPHEEAPAEVLAALHEFVAT